MTLTIVFFVFVFVCFFFLNLVHRLFEFLDKMPVRILLDALFRVFRFSKVRFRLRTFDEPNLIKTGGFHFIFANYFIVIYALDSAHENFGV